MKLWCDNCGKAVDAMRKPDNDFHDEVDTRCYEKYNIYLCPECGEEVFDAPESCELCGELCAPNTELCDSCNSVIREKIATMAADLGVTVSIMTEALADYLAEE